MKIWNEIWDYVKMIIIVVVVVLVVNNVVLINAKIPSESMENTIMTGDRIFGFRMAYGLNFDFFGKHISYKTKDPERFDIIIFKFPDDESQLFIKRVIGLPGETVSFVGGKVYINGEPLDESAYLDDTVETDCGEEDKTFTVPEGSYFMLGDNREISLDARYWKHTYITTDDMKSKEILIIPFHRLPWF